MVEMSTENVLSEERSADLLQKDYRDWILSLKKRYRSAQVKAAVSVNSALLEFYWGLGRDISERYPGKKRWVGFFEKLSEDLRMSLGNAKGLSVNNLRYCLHFYELYCYLLQVVGDNESGRNQVLSDLVKVPWEERELVGPAVARVEAAIAATVESGELRVES